MNSEGRASGSRTLFRGGRVVDGTGRPGWDGHVLVEGDRISAVTPAGANEPQAEHVVELNGRVICPGFVDMHSHADFQLPNEGHEELVRAFLEQGVTSIVAGNCGFSPAPCGASSQARLEHTSSILIDEPLDWGWRSMGEYLEALEAARPALNIAQLVGHAAVRYTETVGEDDGLGRGALDRARGKARDALAEGACGLSFGLGYSPGMYAPLEELEAFARVAAEVDKPVTVHLKAYSRLSPTYPPTDLRPHNLRALREMLTVAERADARLQISHFIFVGRRTWPTAREALGLVDDARRRGRDVMIDAFPYTCGNTTVDVILPSWFRAMGAAAYRSRWARTRVRAELAIGYFAVGIRWDDVQMMAIGVSEWENLNGLSVAEIARRWKMAPVDALLEISERSGGGALALIHSYSGDREGRGPIEDVLLHEACLYETDAIVRSTGWPNPAAVGTFPKILADHVRRDRRLSLEAAIHRMTGASAERFGFERRGTIAEGFAADLVIFDPDSIVDSPGGPGEPAGRPVGIERVLINGVEVVRDGTYQAGVRAGRVLRSG